MTLTPYWSNGAITLYHGDNAELLPAVTADVVLTSPPYNMGLTPGGGGRGMYQPSASRKGGRFRAGYGDGGHDDAMPQHEYDAWQRHVLQLCWEAIPDTGAIYYNHRDRVEHGRLRVPLGGDFGLPLRQRITWDRGTGIGVNTRHYAAVGEDLYLFAKPGWKIRHSASGAGDVWRLGMAHGRDHEDHPAPWPESLPARVIDHNPGAILLDPFVGSGTTLLAAHRFGARAIGIESHEPYCELIVRRLERQAVHSLSEVPADGGKP